MLRSISGRIFVRWGLSICENQFKCYSTLQNSTNASEVPKSGAITASIEFYLQNYQSYENMIQEERKHYENGKKFLARLMGQDPSTFDQEQLDEAIRYLFPSGLQSKKAHPKLKYRSQLLEIQFDKSGRPFHDLYYTGKPAYYEVMHKACALLEELNYKFDRGYIDKDFTAFKNPKQLIIASSEWFTKVQLSQHLLEPVTDRMYENWVLLMNAISKHPLAWHAESFIHSYRVSMQEEASEYAFPEPLVDPQTHSRYVDAYGQKKHAFVELRMTQPGVGKFIVDDKRLLEFFPNLGDREQIMFPLQYTGMIGAVDVVARVSSDTETGDSSKANALRLALARALACFLPGDLGYNRLRAAGLLTQDDRFSERKKPGQKKARKKPIWKAR